MKKFNAIILSVCTTLALASCGNTVTEQESTTVSVEKSTAVQSEQTTVQTKVQTTSEAQTSAGNTKQTVKKKPAAKADYVKAYTDILMNISKEIPEIADAANARFALAYIDNDGIPELVVSEGDAHASACILFTYRDGKAVNLGPFGGYGTLTYYEKGGVIVDGYGNNGHFIEAVYTLENGVAALAFEGETQAEVGGEVYFIDGIEVSEKEYNTAKSKIVPKGAKEAQVEYKNCHKITKTDIEKIIK